MFALRSSNKTAWLLLEHERVQDFGETPAYVLKRKEEMKRAQDEYDAYVAEHFRRGAMRQLTDDERQSIVDGLKQNWEQLHSEYQQLSVVIDTVPKQYRKERLEADMKQLEKDVELFELHPVIYITNWLPSLHVSTSLTLPLEQFHPAHSILCC